MATKRKPTREKVTTERFFREQAEPLEMRLVAGGNGLGRTIIEPTVNRPSLALAGFTKYIAFKRIQVSFTPTVIKSAVFISNALVSAADRLGSMLLNTAATPLTTGAEAEVPENPP